MIDFEEARRTAFAKFSQQESTKIVDKSKIPLLVKSNLAEVWEVTSEVYDKQDKILSLTFLIGFEFDFPLSIPKIYLLDKDKNIGYLPHINEESFICSFDVEGIKTNTSMPSEIIEECFLRTKRIIEDGLKEKNFKEFEEEFISYWENIYGSELKVLTGFLLLIPEEQITEQIKLLEISPPFGGYNTFIFNNEGQVGDLKDYLKGNNYTYKEREAFYIGDLNLNYPPFNKSNFEIIEIIKGNEGFYKNFKTYCNINVPPLFVFFSKIINGKKAFFGWIHECTTLPNKGFRVNKYSNIEILTKRSIGFKGNENIIRIKVQDYTKTRRQLRTNGLKENKEYVFTVAGLGSIGSNLIFFLRSLDNPHFKLIDVDTLAIENINRHLLGLINTGKNKTSIVKNFLENHFPERKVLIKDESIINVIIKEPEFINESDYLFVAIGKENIEEYIADALKEKIIKVPTFILWVEPYLLGGHCIFIHPEDNHFKYKDLYSDNGFFKYNVISENEYLNNNPKLRLKEAGCQESFIPYSSSNVILFLSFLFPKMFEIINRNQKTATTISWIGDLKLAEELKIAISDLYKENNSNQIIQH